MKKLKIESLFKVLFFVIINIFFNNIIVFIISILIIFNRKSYDYIVFLVIFLLIILNNNIKKDYIKIGFVDSKTDKYVIVNKIIYKCKVYDKELDPGDIVLFESSNSILDTNSLKNNIKFEHKGNTFKLFKNHLKKFIYEYINNSKYKDIYNPIYYNVINYEYDNFENISYNFAFYYLVLIIFRKNKHLSILLLCLYSILFGFQVKFFLIIINYLTSFYDFDRNVSLSIKVLIIAFINKYLFFNYSIIMSIIFSSISSFNNGKTNPLLIGVIQTLFFGEVKILSSLFYKVYIFEKIFIFCISSISLIVPLFANIFVLILSFMDRIMLFLNISIRGIINLFILGLLLYLFNKLNIKNIYLKYLLFLFYMLIPFNLLTTHINFIDVGQGDSALIVDAKDQITYLIDTGSQYNYYKLKRELYNEGIYKIDYLIITHNDSDHNGNIMNIHKDFIVKNIIEEGKDLKSSSVNLKYLYLGENDNDNDNSLVYLVNIDNYNVLFTGDISSNIENNIIFNHNINDIDILKVSHHGSSSASSSYFVGTIKPEFGIISTNGMYNHPSDRVVDSLKQYNVKTYITKTNGNIKFCFTKFIDYIKTSDNQFVIINK